MGMGGSHGRSRKCAGRGRRAGRGGAGPVLVEMRKQRPDGEVIALLMRRFIYTAGITGLMQVATLIIMTRVATQ